MTHLLESGDDHIAFGDTRDAISDYTEAIKLDPKCADAYSRRAGAKEELNDLAGALADYDKAIELNQADADCYYYRGLIKADEEDFAAALANFNRDRSLGNRS